VQTAVAVAVAAQMLEVQLLVLIRLALTRARAAQAVLVHLEQRVAQVVRREVQPRRVGPMAQVAAVQSFQLRFLLL
jgi:hypothetical protein